MNVLSEETMSKFTHVIKRSGAIVPFKRERVMNAIYRSAVSVGGRDKDTAEKLADKVIEVMETRFPDGHMPHIEEIQDVVEKVLIEQGHAKVAKEYILYRDERNRSRMEDAKHASHPSEFIPWPKIWRVLNWAVKYKLNTVESMNERIRNGEFPQIVHESERRYDEQIYQASQMIIERRDKLKMVFISGPSSSGKTTTTLKLEQRLNDAGLKFRALIVDNYFHDLEMHPKDEFGDYDFETPQALDLEMIDNHLTRLAAGEEVKIPYYDFKTGTQYPDRTPMHLEEDEILLIDSLHGLYPKMSEDIPNDQKFKLYLEPLMQMKDADDNYVQWTDIRLIRRMLRDSVHRAYNPQQTLEHWHYVRASELRNIIPFINTADYIVNSAMPYELPLYRSRMFHLFEEWKDKYKGDPVRVDSDKRANRVYNLLKQIEPIEDDSPVHHDSVLREFIGGSSLKY